MGFRSARAIRPLVLALVVGCATQRSDSAIERSNGNGGAASKAQPAAGDVALDDGDPPRIASVHITNVAPARFVLDAASPVNIALAATLERRSAGGEWTPEPYELRDGCAPRTDGVSGCRALRPGAPFNPLSWNGTACGPCCAEQEPRPIERGSYRLMLRACDDSSVRWEGPSFEMPGATDAVERWRATTAVQKASLFQLGGVRDETENGHDDRHVVGYPILAGSEVALSTSLVGALRDWLRDAAGFSDAVMRRCSPGKRFGFRLERDIPGLGQERSEVAVDLDCHLIVVVNQEGSLRPRSYSYFDNSRQALLGLLRQAMPEAAWSDRQR